VQPEKVPWRRNQKYVLNMKSSLSMEKEYTAEESLMCKGRLHESKCCGIILFFPTLVRYN
jgi:hypothetical protein